MYVSAPSTPDKLQGKNIDDPTMHNAPNTKEP